MKDEKRLIFQDAQGLLRQGKGRRESFQKRKLQLEVWDISGFELERCPYKLRVVRYQETHTVTKEEHWMWLIKTLETAASRVLWKMLHKRWDIEENGFHQLKTYYHADRCYCHGAVEVITLLLVMGFNMRELYLYRRLKIFAGSGVTGKA